MTSRARMVLWSTARVVAGSATTVTLCLFASILITQFGAVWREPFVVGLVPVLPLMILLLCPVLGGALTGFLQAGDWKVGTLLGCLAGALGGTFVGAVLGAALAVLASASLDPGTSPNISAAMTTIGLYAAGIGLVSGAVMGALGGTGGWYLQRTADI